MRSIRTRVVVLVTAVMLFSGIRSARAGTTSWLTSGTQDWGDAANWGGTLPDDIASIPATTTANCPDLKGNSFAINELSFEASGNLFGNGVNTPGGLLTLNAASAGDEMNTGLRLNSGSFRTYDIFANLALGMANRTNEHKWYTPGGYQAKFFQFGRIEGTGALHILGSQNSSSTLGYFNVFDTNGAVFNGDTTVDMGCELLIAPSNIASSVNYRFGRNATFGSDTWGGVITLTASSALQTYPAQFRFVPILTNPVATTVTLQNDFVVRGMIGGLVGVQSANSFGTALYPKVVYGGKLTLGGRLMVVSEGDNYTGVNGDNASGDTTAAHFVPFTQGTYIDQTLATRTEIQPNRCNLVTWPAPIYDTGAGPYQNPLILSDDGSDWQLSGTNSTYKYGTVFGGTATITVNAPTNLGSGNVLVMPGCRVLLAVSNVLNAAHSILDQHDDGAKPRQRSDADQRHGGAVLSLRFVRGLSVRYL